MLDFQNFHDPLEGDFRDVEFANFSGMIDFADWLRLALLWKHGGVWLDATLLLTAPLDFLVNDTVSLSGVHLEGRLENFFLAAPKGEEVIQRWRDHLFHIVQFNESEYSQHLKDLRSHGIQPLNGRMADCDWRVRSWAHGFAHKALHLFARMVNSMVGYSNFYLHICNATWSQQSWGLKTGYITVLD
eukprot:symbB.v1.2.037915.t1/scaffold5722.1/size24223/1